MWGDNIEMYIGLDSNQIESKHGLARIHFKSIISNSRGIKDEFEVIRDIVEKSLIK